MVLGGEKDPETGDIGCYTETIKLLDYAKKNFSLQTITSADTPIQEVPVRFAAGKEHTKLVAAADSELLLHNDTDLSQVTYEVDAVSTADAPIKKGEKLGTAKVFIGDTEYGTIDLVASEDIERSDVLYALFQVQEFFKSPLFRIILVVLILLILLLVFVSTKRRRARRRRRARSRYSSGHGRR